MIYEGLDGVMDLLGPGTNVWIKHKGKVDPTPSGSLVDLRLVDGTEIMSKQAHLVEWNKKKKHSSAVKFYRYTMISES